MIVYLITFLIASLSASCAHYFYSKSKIVFLFFSIITILVPTLVAGFRSDTVGTDMNFYLLDIYDKAAEYSDPSQILTDPTFEPVFLALVFSGLKLFNSLQGILLMLAVTNMTLVYSALCMLRDKLHLGFAVAVYLFLFFNDSLNLMRQHIAVSICFFSFACLYRKNYIRCGIAYVIALFAHSTSFIFVLPLVAFELFRRGKLKIKSTMMKVYWIGLPLSLLIFDLLLNTLISVGVVSEKYMRYLTSENESGTRFPLSFIFFFFLFFVLGYQMIKKIPKSWDLLHLKTIIRERDTTEVMKSYFIFDLYSISMVGLSTMVSLWVARMNIYFQILMIALFPIILYRVKSSDVKSLKWGFLALLFLYWFWTFIHVNNGETYPYHSDILGI